MLSKVEDYKKNISSPLKYVPEVQMRPLLL